MQSNRRSNTRPELLIRSALHRRGLRFRKDHPIVLADGKVRPDIVFTRKRIAVFIDGCFWHGCPSHFVPPKTNQDYWVPKIARNIDRDRRRDSQLAFEGWIVARIWEHETLADAVRKIVELAEPSMLRKS